MIGSTKYQSLSKSDEYLEFRSKVPLRKVCVDPTRNKVWWVYDTGPRCVKSPVVCLPPAGGTADLFYRQLTALSDAGIRALAVDYPSYSRVQDWCEGFRRMMDILRVDSAHIIGVSLGGFLGQQFSALTHRCPRVASLLLCQSYCDSAHATTRGAIGLHWLLPTAAVRSLVADLDHHGCSRHNTDAAYNFAVEQLHKLSPQLLSSRVALTIDTGFVPKPKQHLTVTLIDAFTTCESRERAKTCLTKLYPEARLAYCRHSTTLPYLDQHDEFFMYTRVHLNKFTGTDQDPCGGHERLTSLTNLVTDSQL